MEKYNNRIPYEEIKPLLLDLSDIRLFLKRDYSFLLTTNARRTTLIAAMMVAIPTGVLCGTAPEEGQVYEEEGAAVTAAEATGAGACVCTVVCAGACVVCCAAAVPPL